MIPIPTIEGGFRVITADPAWNFKVRTPAGQGRSAERHYDTMSLAEIKALPVASVAAKDCHLFMWITGPHLMLGGEVMKAWGFRYSGIAFTWVKLKRSIAAADGSLSNGWRRGNHPEEHLHCGMGYTTRKNCEFVLLGRRGSPRRNAKDVREVIVSPLREHSRKPDEFFRRVNRYAGGPRLELFSREPREGWERWGNQVNHFSEHANGNDWQDAA